MKKVMLLAMIVYYVIIIASFSAQSAAESSAGSHEITGALYDKVIVHFDKQQNLGREAFIEIAEHFIRKCAHFGNFFILSLLVSGFVTCFQKSYAVSGATIFGVCFLFAFFDEIHQLFVDGRSCQFTDMLIDSSGSAFGILLFYAASFLHKGEAVK